MLHIRPGKGGGIFVASELLPHDVLVGNIAVETNCLVEILCGRRVIEATVTHRASARGTPDDYAELERIGRLLFTNRHSREAVLRADGMFHMAVARAAHNRLLTDVMRLVSRQLVPLRDLHTGASEEVERILDIHARQLRAMRSREPQELDAVLDEHFSVLEERFAASLGQTRETLFGGPPSRVATPFEPPWQKLASLEGGYRAHAWLERAALDTAG